MAECTAAGPSAQLAAAARIDRFYGFLQGETDQFYPELTSDNHFVDTPARSPRAIIVSEDIV